MNQFSLSDEEVVYIISALYQQGKRLDLTRLDREFSAATLDKFASKIAHKLDSKTLAIIEGS